MINAISAMVLMTTARIIKYKFCWMKVILIKINLDSWQKDFIACKGDKILCTGRQVGKTEACARDCVEWAMKTLKKGIILMTAPQEFQAETLFNKTLAIFIEEYKFALMIGKDRPTKTEIKLKKGIIIICKTAGTSGFGLRSMTVIRTYIDECSQMPDACWEAIDPQSLMTDSDTIYLSTPFGMQGRFYDCWINKNEAYKSFTRFSIDSETCIKERKISPSWTQEQREKALIKIEQARMRMTHKQFMQEYMGKFIESLMQFFPDKLIKECMIVLRPSSIQAGKYYLGVDVGGKGGSESTFSILKKISNKRFIQIESINVNYEMVTMTEREIIHLDNLYHFRKILIDSGGLGVGVTDHLLENPAIKKRIIEINNSKRNIEPETEEHPKIVTLMKNDLYNNLLCLMERGEIELLDDPAIFQSLKSVQFEITERKDLLIFGEYTHLAESIIRSAWGAVKDKSLNLWVY
jgi:hypothetical protein